jgi:preprotein translocase subunit SecD
MMISRFGFNTYLAVGLAAALLAVSGCRTAESKRKKALATFRVHLESNPRPNSLTEQITVGREHPEVFTIEKDPFLTESHVKSAKVIDAYGGFALSVAFDRQGAWLLEQYTAANRGRHLAIFSQFPTPPDEKLNEGRWLAAPYISEIITNGVLTFTPDATREEADQIVLGLTHVATKIQSGEDLKD